MDLNIYPTLPRRKDFRIGIIGSGFIVNDCHLVAYRKAGLNPVAIASRHAAHAARVAQRHGIAKAYKTVEELLADPSVEVLDVAVPPNEQLALIQAACSRKTVKGILAQKPLGSSYAEAAEAVSACEAAGITLAANQNMRYDQSVRAARTLLDRGTLGEPVFATIEMRGIPHWMDWHKDLGWLTLRIMSIHHLDTFRYWFGDPESIYCSIRPDPRTRFPHADGICTYILEYRGGLRCVGIDDTWTGPAKEGCPAENYIRWRIEGLNGLAIGDIGWCKDPYTTPSTIRYAAKGDKEFKCPTWPESWFPDAFIGTMAQLLVALENGTEPEISGKDNLKTMALVEAAYISAAQFRSIEMNTLKLADTVSGEVSLEQKKGFFAKLFSNPATLSSSATHSEFSEEDYSFFTPRARRVLEEARREAEGFNHHFIGTEHLLLGLLAFGQGIAFKVLAQHGVDLQQVRKRVKEMIGADLAQQTFGKLPFTPRGKQALALARKEARTLNHTYIGTEHILLGLLHEHDGVANRLLAELGVQLSTTRQEILQELDPNSS